MAMYMNIQLPCKSLPSEIEQATAQQIRVGGWYRFPSTEKHMTDQFTKHGRQLCYFVKASSFPMIKSVAQHEARNRALHRPVYVSLTPLANMWRAVEPLYVAI